MASFSMCTRMIRPISLIRGLIPARIQLHRLGQPLSTTATETNSNKDTPPEDSGDSKSEGGPSEAELKLTQEKEKLQSNYKELEDKYKRALAETENVRLRMKKQIEDTKLFGIQGFCKDLLEVADILKQATESVPKEELNGNNPHLKSLFQGLTMTEDQLKKVFKRNGLVMINPEQGEKFDPHVHEALFEQPLEGKPAGTIAVVTKTGYMLHSRTLRPALVGVVKSTS
ncbi:grpE protein homolog 1, mitochondrial-like [Lineus longissimus]|uniref:grpE protein homolog 1, mitochondrial-like n=1 Tax=Lineus longissimus TaxID=88925 RepID=UPI002B4EA5F1